MTYQPNYEAAREAFARRVSDELVKTWHGYGFVGPAYSREAADDIASAISKRDFPLPGAAGRIPAGDSWGDGVVGD